MDEQSVIDLLISAYSCFQTGNMNEYHLYMNQAKELLDVQPEQNEAYGEWVLMSSMAYLFDLDMKCEKYREAAKYINGHSRVLPSCASLFGIYYNPFACANIVPGHADENADKLTEAVDLFHNLTGGGMGTDICYRAQLAFYKGDLRTARSLALKAKETAEKGEQELVALCAVELLAQIAKHESDKTLWQFAFGYIEAIANETQFASRGCREQAQAISAMLSLSLGVLKPLPDWIAKNDYGAIPMPWGYRIIGDKIRYGSLSNAMLAQIEYYNYNGEPVQALNLADMFQKIYKIDNLLTNAYLEFFRAGCYLQLNDIKSSCDAIKKAIEIISVDKLYLIAAEFAPTFGTVIYDIADEETAKNIEQIANSFWDKLTPLRKKLLEDVPRGLTKREMEILPFLFAGRSNVEIAAALFITEHTVKRHVANIYTKLNISRRAQAADAVNRLKPAQAAFWTKKQ